MNLLYKLQEKEESDIFITLNKNYLLIKKGNVFVALFSDQPLFLKGVAGKEKDKESGLQYYGARYYDPDLRVFVEADSIIPDYYNPQSLNRYTYVLNNPYKYVDETGHRPGQPFSLDRFFLSDFTGIPTYAISGFSEMAADLSNQYKSSPISNVVNLGLSYSMIGPTWEVTEWGVKESIYQSTKGGNVMPIGGDEIGQIRTDALYGTSSLLLKGGSSSSTFLSSLSTVDTLAGAFDVTLLESTINTFNYISSSTSYGYSSSGSYSSSSGGYSSVDDYSGDNYCGGGGGGNNGGDWWDDFWDGWDWW